MQVSVSIEAQQGLTWLGWTRLVEAVERLGYAGLYRSDHFSTVNPALELIVSLAYAAQNSQRIRFGPLVAPVTFRQPAMLARQAAALDDLSGGRLVLGLGAGWEENEHHTWGYALGDPSTRSARFEEGLEVIRRLLTSDGPVTFEGDFFKLREARLLPRPDRQDGPDILIGGNGRRRTLPLAARYADVWNVVHLPPEMFRSRSLALDELLEKEGRQPGDLKRTLLMMVLCGRNEQELKRRAAHAYRMWAPHLADEPFADLIPAMDAMFSPFMARIGASFCPIVGSPDQVVEQIQAYSEVGLEELIIQWWDPDDVESLHAYSEQILSRLN
jgi:alkanesulfonate monooxygenase SsuD/methylene tetrahydromethanopterin reductase-like flavin-dependent oxidoreductase (luciferase family)